jgi:hypothetical protein
VEQHPHRESCKLFRAITNSFKGGEIRDRVNANDELEPGVRGEAPEGFSVEQQAGTLSRCPREDSPTAVRAVTRLEERLE